MGVFQQRHQRLCVVGKCCDQCQGVTAFDGRVPLEISAKHDQCDVVVLVQGGKIGNKIVLVVRCSTPCIEGVHGLKGVVQMGANALRGFRTDFGQTEYTDLPPCP